MLNIRLAALFRSQMGLKSGGGCACQEGSASMPTWRRLASQRQIKHVPQSAIVCTGVGAVVYTGAKSTNPQQ